MALTLPEPRGGRRLTQWPRNRYTYNPVAGWSSLAARRAHNPKVEGSNPSPATNKQGLADGGPFVFSGPRHILRSFQNVLEHLKRGSGKTKPAGLPVLSGMANYGFCVRCGGG